MFSAFTLLLLAGPACGGGVRDAVIATQHLRADRQARDAPEVPAFAYDRAEAGEVVAGITVEPERAVGKAWGVAVFEVPVEAVWMAVNDEHAFPTVSAVQISQVVAGDPRRSGRTVFGSRGVGVPLVKDRWWMVTVQHNASMFERSGGQLWEKSWEDASAPGPALEGAPRSAAMDGQRVTFTRGAWLLHRLDSERTLVEYYVWTDIGGTLPPAAISHLAQGAARRQIEGMRRLAERHEASSRAGWVAPDQRPL